MTSNQYPNISIIEIATQLGIIVKKNKAICFAHREKSPSLTFSDKKGVYYCHGCGIKGNIFTLVRDVLQLDSKATFEWLNNLYPQKYPHLTQNIALKNKPAASNSWQYMPNPEIYEWLINETGLSSNGKYYLNNIRGFKDATLQSLRIADILRPNEFFSKMESIWGSDKLIKCGLAKIDKYSNIKSIWWDHVIIFPFFNLENKATYLQARRLKQNVQLKYINLKGVKKEIYNFQCISKMIPGDNLFICEGIPDTITMFQLGFKSIGILGANSFNEYIVPFLLDFSIYVIPDLDNAGKGFANKITQSFNKVGKQVKTVSLPKGIKDVNELYTTNSRD